MQAKLLDGVLRPGGLALTAELVKVCGFKPGDRVLDLGCGTGVTVAYLTAQWELKAVGVDRDPGLVAEGKQREPTLSLLTAEGAALPFEDAVFDGVIAECSLSVMEDQPAVLREVGRVLQPGGRLAISDLYRKKETALGSGEEASSPSGCRSGAPSRQEWETGLAEQGFRLLYWQDASRYLAEFVAQYIMTYGSLDQVWLSPHQPCGRGTGSKGIGYFLAVAQKSGPGDHV